LKTNDAESKRQKCFVLFHLIKLPSVGSSDWDQLPPSISIGLNEVALGMTLPWFAIELARHRLTRRYFDICTVSGTLLGPEEARSAGFLDELATPDRLQETALEKAGELATIDMGAHVATKLRIRGPVLAGVADGIDRLSGSDSEW
jgi:enoyl-CoA hydratase/carnithine racemase